MLCYYYIWIFQDCYDLKNLALAWNNIRHLVLFWPFYVYFQLRSQNQNLRHWETCLTCAKSFLLLSMIQHVYALPTIHLVLLHLFFNETIKFTIVKFFTIPSILDGIFVHGAGFRIVPILLCVHLIFSTIFAAKCTHDKIKALPSEDSNKDEYDDGNCKEWG